MCSYSLTNRLPNCVTQTNKTKTDGWHSHIMASASRYQPVSNVTVDLSVLGCNSCFSLMFNGNFLDRCSICWIALLESFNRLLQVPVVTSFFATVRYLLLPFLGKKNTNLLITRTSTRYFLRDAVSRVWARIWSLGDNLSRWLKFLGTFLFLGGHTN